MKSIDQISSSYTVVDIETPNRFQRSLCSIGLVNHEANKQPNFQYFLVNPEDSFDPTNTNIHGITADEVKGAPTFPEVWDKISDYFTNGLIVAHNASFDIPVIRKALEHYGLPIPDIYYICTLKKSRKHIEPTRFNGYSLKTLCDGYQISFEHHHNALEDVKACASLFQRLQSDFGFFEEDIGVYSSPNGRVPEKLDAEAEKSLNTLHGILEGIGFDRHFLPLEYERLTLWVKEHQLSSVQDIKICKRAITTALEDGKLSQDEYDGLMHLTATEPMCESQFCKTTQATQKLLGILDGIACDGVIQLPEAQNLMEWLRRYSYLKGFYPYDKIIGMLSKMLEDDFIDPVEEQELLDGIRVILHPVEDASNVKFDHRVFCLTGDFLHGAKDEIAVIIESRGGSIASGVSKKVDYVVVGGQGSDKWAFGNYGGKVKKALDLIEQGISIQIIREDSLFDD